MIRNLAIDQHRARLTRPAETESVDDLDLAADDAIDHILATQIVVDALSELPTAQRDVLTLTYNRGHTVAQTAALLGVPAGTVKSRSYYALRTLRDILQARGVIGS